MSNFAEQSIDNQSDSQMSGKDFTSPRRNSLSWSLLCRGRSSMLNRGSGLAVVGAVLALGLFAAQVEGHARLMQPVSRASAWRKGFNTPTDFNDSQGFCGGFLNQHNNNDGKCGICGDPWEANPRQHETGGVFATGTIVETYRPGEDIDVEIDLTANHKGYFTFKLCANNDTQNDPVQECFDQTVLMVLPDKSDRYTIPDSSRGTYVIRVRLPHVWCSQCILQWTYTCGNNWGMCEDGTGAVGCGPQETFRACSDIQITGEPVENTDDNETTISHDTTKQTNGPTPSRPTYTPVYSTERPNFGDLVCESVGPHDTGDNDYWCNINCNYVPPYCPESHCKCVSKEEADNL